MAKRQYGIQPQGLETVSEPLSMNRKMKKYIPILIIALAAVSCMRENPVMPDFRQPEGIVLYLSPGGPNMVTKTDPNTDSTRDGDFDGSFNENLIGSTVDVFFFDSDADETTPAIYHDNFPVDDISGNKVVSISLSTEKINAIFGSETNGNTAYVVVIANYGPSINHNNTYTLNDLCSLALPTANWNTFPQASFPMISNNGTETSTSPFTLITITEAGGKIPVQADVNLKRLAAKITFRMTISERITVVNVERDPYGNIEDHSLVDWVPRLEGMTAYMQYAMKVGTLSGTPVQAPSRPPLYSIPDNIDVMAYDERPFKRTTDVITRTRIPVRLDENSPTHEPIEGTPEDVDLPVYEVCSGLGSTESGPFYSYPVTWTPGSAGEPFIKLIIPWTTVNTGNDRTKYYYYKVPFEKAPLKSNHWYVITLDVQILGGEDQQPIPLTASYQVVDWEKGTEVDVPTEVQSARFLSVPITEWVMYNMDELTIPITSSHDVQIVGYKIKPSATTRDKNSVGQAFSAADKADKLNTWVGTSPSIYNPFLSGDTNRYTIDSSTDIGTVLWTKPNYNGDGMGGAAVPVTTGNDASSWFTTVDNQSIVIRHDLINDLNSKDGSNKPNYDVVPYYLYFRVQHKDKPEYYKDILVEQRPAIVLEPQLNSAGDANTNKGYVYINGEQGTSTTNNNVWRYVAGLTGTNKNPNMYVITTSVLDSEDMIGDPRETTAKTDNQVYSGWNSASLRPVDSQTQRRLTNYYPAMETEAARSYIAPSFRVASSYGVTQSISYDNAKRRCAAYQEDGYPAGRWRLPTKAEVLFITTLSADGMIPELFSFDNSQRDKSYWCANGAIDGAYGVPTFYDDDMNTARYVRCVYDEWFWSDTEYSRVAISNPRWGDQLRENVVKN